jgi:hypothetical protein
MDDAWEGLGKLISGIFNRYCKVSLKTQEGVKKSFENRRGICRPLEIFNDINLKTGHPEMRCWLLTNPSDGRLVVTAKYKTEGELYGGFPKL